MKCITYFHVSKTNEMCTNSPPKIFDSIKQTCGLTRPQRMTCDRPGAFLTHWGRVTHICVGKLTIIDSDNGLSPGRRQAIIWTIAGIMLIGPLGTHFNEILIGIQTFSFKKMHLKMSSAKWRPFGLGLNVLNNTDQLWPQHGQATGLDA